MSKETKNDPRRVECPNCKHPNVTTVRYCRKCDAELERKLCLAK